MVGRDIGERRTAFPNMFIESMSLETPPFDEPGVIQEFVGRGVTREFDRIQTLGGFTKDRVQRVINELEDQVGPLRDSFRVRYNLIVRVPISNPFTRRGVSIRARTWARLKNPFEPDMIEVSPPQHARGMSEDLEGEFYRVTVTVTK